MDTLAVRLALPTTKRAADFHRQVVAHAGRTNGKTCSESLPQAFLVLKDEWLVILFFDLLEADQIGSYGHGLFVIDDGQLIGQIILG